MIALEELGLIQQGQKNDENILNFRTTPDDYLIMPEADIAHNMKDWFLPQLCARDLFVPTMGANDLLLPGPASCEGLLPCVCVSAPVALRMPELPAHSRFFVLGRNILL